MDGRDHSRSNLYLNLHSLPRYASFSHLLPLYPSQCGSITHHVNADRNGLPALALPLYASSRCHFMLQGTIFIKKEQYDRAEPLLRETVKALTERSLPGNLSVGGAQALLGRVLLREKHYRESGEQLTAAYAILAKQPGTSYLKMLQQTREDLATVYEALHQPDKAAKFRTELVANQPRKVDAPIGN